MKEKPTIFQLAQLAAQAAPPNSKAKDAVRRAIELWSEAEMGIAEYESRVEFLRGLFRTSHGKDIPIFTDSPENWRARLKAYPGDARDVDRALWEQTFPVEVVGRQLFRNRTLTKAVRQKFLVGLARVCIRFDMEGPVIPHHGRLKYLEGGEFVGPEPGFPIHPKNLEKAEKNYQGAGKMLIPARELRFVKQVESLLSQPTLYAHLVRWAVEVRQRQLTESRTRLIPESLRQQAQKQDREERIQFKKAFRQ